MTTMIEKITSPTTRLLPATNSLKPLTTPPAASVPLPPASVRIKRVVATLSTRRDKVVANNSDGKTLNSNGVRTVIVVSNTITATVMLAASSRSISAAGTGTKITARLATRHSGKIRSCARAIEKPARGMAAVAIPGFRVIV